MGIFSRNENAGSGVSIISACCLGIGIVVICVMLASISSLGPLIPTIHGPRFTGKWKQVSTSALNLAPPDKTGEAYQQGQVPLNPLITIDLVGVTHPGFDWIWHFQAYNYSSSVWQGNVRLKLFDGQIYRESVEIHGLRIPPHKITPLDTVKSTAPPIPFPRGQIVSYACDVQDNSD